MKQYARITLALIVGLISFNSYAADDMTNMDHSNMTPEQMKSMKEMDHSNMTPEQMKQMKKEMDHGKMTPEQMKELPVATQAETPTAAKVGEGMPENAPEKAVKKSAKKKSIKKVKKPSVNK